MYKAIFKTNSFLNVFYYSLPIYNLFNFILHLFFFKKINKRPFAIFRKSALHHGLLLTCIIFPFLKILPISSKNTKKHNDFKTDGKNSNLCYREHKSNMKNEKKNNFVFFFMYGFWYIVINVLLNDGEYDNTTYWWMFRIIWFAEDKLGRTKKNIIFKNYSFNSLFSNANTLCK